MTAFFVTMVRKWSSSSDFVTRSIEVMRSSGSSGSRFVMFMPRLVREPSGIS